MSDIFDVAISCWSLEKWINNLQTNSSKTAAMNYVRRIKQYLKSEGIEFIDFTGRDYDVSFPLVIVNAEDITDNSIIIEMTKPVIISKTGRGVSGEAYVGEKSKKE